MNKQRRKKIDAICHNICKIQEQIKNGELVDEDALQNAVDDLYNEINDIYDEESDYLYNIPENLQASSVYEKAEEACDNLSEAMDVVGALDIPVEDPEKFVSDLDEAISYLEEASA